MELDLSSESNKNVQECTIDLVMFMGQSNMAGRGTASEAPAVPKGYGYEFRAISNQDKLYDIIEPFGVNENNINGINEPNMKTGSLVSAFVIEYYKLTNVPIVGVSASKGGSSIKEWQPGGSYLEDAIARFNTANTFLNNKGYKVRKKFMVWCQGETDGDKDISPEEYKAKIKTMLEAMFNSGIENCFLIRIGNHRDLPAQYSKIQKAQTEFCNENKKVILVSTKFDEMVEVSLMKAPFHYKQTAYNIVGAEAGKNTAFYVINKEKEN